MLLQLQIINSNLNSWSVSHNNILQVSYIADSLTPLSLEGWLHRSTKLISPRVFSSLGLLFLAFASLEIGLVLPVLV